MTEQERALCNATARLLQASNSIAAWGQGLSFIAMGALALTGRSMSTMTCLAFGSVAIVGIYERYTALRLRFDVGLFDGLASGTIASLGALDEALRHLGLRPAHDADRGLSDRAQGARRLMRRHGIAVASQSALFLLALLTREMR